MRPRTAGLAAAGLVAAAVGAQAQEFSLNRPGSGARSAGMGNAFIALSDDGTAASWNPAGLSQLRKPEFSLVYNTSHRSRSLEGYRTRDGSAAFTTLASSSTDADLEFASAAAPFGVGGKAVTLQVGWRRLYQITSAMQGDTSRVPAGAASRPPSLVRVDNTSKGNIDLWSLAGAVRLTTRLSLGVSVDLYRGGWEDRVSANEDPGVLGPTDFSSRLTTNRVSGHNVNLGLLLAYPSLRVGLVYHGAFSSDYDVTESIRSSLAEPIDGTFDSGPQLLFPRSIGLGVAWLPRPLLRLAADVTYDEWTRFLVEGTPGSPDRAVSGFDGLPPELSATRDTFTLNLGLEKLFPLENRYVPLRLGFSREPHGGRDPLVRDDFDAYILAAGTGLNTNSVKFDVSLEYRWGSYRNTQNISPVYQIGRAEAFSLPPPPEAEGTLRVSDWRLKAAIIYRVTDTGKLRDLLRKVFGS